MGTNESFLSVHVGDRSSPEEVEAAIVASYEARGARAIGREHQRELQRQPFPPARAVLGVAVGPVERGWVTICDSFGYTSDARLAADLAQQLGTTVFRTTIADAVGHEALERFGAPLDASQAPGEVSWAYRDLDQSVPGFRFLVIDGVRRDAYAYGPSIRVEVTCPSCGNDAGWCPGADVPWAPRATLLYALRPPPKRRRWPRLLFHMSCPCGASLGWGRAILEAGILADVRRLKRPRVAAFDLALVAQRAQIDALSKRTEGGSD